MNNILGKSPYAIKGKSVRGQPDAVKTEHIPVPRSILERYKDVTICVDVMFVCQVAILVSVSQSIHYGTVHGLPSMKIPIMEEAIKGIVKSYAVRGFLVKFIFVDLQFKAIKDQGNIKGAIVNIVS